MNTHAKQTLARTIRDLRARLITDFSNAFEARYRLAHRPQDAGLDAGRRAERARIDEWIHTQERGESSKKKKERRTREDFIAQALREAAYTLINRLVLIRLMEEEALIRPAVLKGGWNSPGYREWCEWAPALIDDETDGYAYLLKLLFDELAIDLPGLFGDVGLTSLIPLPPQTLRFAVEAINNPALTPCWSDDTTLGWVYQYFNDPDREALDAKISARGKVEPHEIASKTQLFTERYMVEWLLQNSLGNLWFEICAANGWTPEVVQTGVLTDLEHRRAQWREKREAGEVALDELMPIRSDVEERWKYYVPAGEGGQDARAPKSTRELKLLDPACGSGHFLVIAFDLLFALYKEEARHRNKSWSDEEITHWIIEDNLHGIDIDPRAVQIAAAALFLKARSKAPTFRPKKLNLVAPDLTIGNLPDDDPALVELREAVEKETGIPAALVDKIVQSLKEAHHLGTLLKIDDEIDQAIRKFTEGHQSDLFIPRSQSESSLEEESDARQAISKLLEDFLARHSRSDDLGLRLRGEQLANGIRFLRLNREGKYDLIVANPPYLGRANLRSKKYIEKNYPAGRADLYACFLERGIQLVREGGLSAMVTMRGWLFIKTYEALRKDLLSENHLIIAGDLDRGAFEEIAAGSGGVAAIMTIFRNSPISESSIVLRPSPLGSVAHDLPEKRAALLAQIDRHNFSPHKLEGIEGQPLVYWWSEEFLDDYLEYPKIAQVAETRVGLRTSNNLRFLRSPWEAKSNSVLQISPSAQTTKRPIGKWIPYIKGSAGRAWFEPLNDIIEYSFNGLEVSVTLQEAYNALPQSPEFYYQPGVAFSMIGANFSARAHRFRSIFGNKGSSVFPEDIPNTLCLMNSSIAKEVMESLNPGVGFEVGDVNRLPLFPIESADQIYAQIEEAFTEHEKARETSVEFKKPGPSCWEYAQEWAQEAVDRPKGAPLPDWTPKYDDVLPESWLSWALGVAIGRFDEAGQTGWLHSPPPHALDGGILYVSNTDSDDSLSDPACDLLHEMWERYGEQAGRKKDDLNSWLRERFFTHVHRQQYENAPIYFPLSSARKNFVAHVHIHQWDSQTLRKLLASHLHPERQQLETLRDNLRAQRDTAQGRARTDIDRRLDQTLKLLDELNEFIAHTHQCSEFGPPPTDAKCPPREVDAPYDPVLDDGTMINASALWPLLDPQWKHPKRWWKQLATEKGTRGKHYDWSQLARRYFPTRVDQKCQQDPSLAIAHGCFWRYHPHRAYEWELRLQDEIHENFTIDEPGSDTARQAFLAEHTTQARAIAADEQKRRQRRSASLELFATED